AYAERYCWAQQPNDRHVPSYLRRSSLPDGHVRLECAVNQERRLACAVAEEHPTGWGYGEAALRLSRHYRLCEGVAYPEPISLQILFVNHDEPKSAPSP
ncbi:MAG: hypothetical protein ACREH4_11150, partial [Vitreimonas sp.]